jgi:hypothetical protein
MVSKWEAGTVPGPINQAALDTALRMCTHAEAIRFSRCPSRPVPREPEAEPACQSTPTAGKEVAAYGDPLPAGLWTDEGMRAALHDHDIAYLFKVLQYHQLSQRTIARIVGMQQAEISEILAGRRVRQYDALLRICVGLRIPRHVMGLSC